MRTALYIILIAGTAALSSCGRSPEDITEDEIRRLFSFPADLTLTPRESFDPSFRPRKESIWHEEWTFPGRKYGSWVTISLQPDADQKPPLGGAEKRILESGREMLIYSFIVCEGDFWDSMATIFDRSTGRRLSVSYCSDSPPEDQCVKAILELEKKAFD